MTVNEIKTILAQKLKDEECSFKKSDIIVKKTNNGFIITIKEYEHCPFKMTFDEDEYFGFEVWIYDTFNEEMIAFTDSKKDYDVKSALLSLGYTIANTF